MQDKTMSLKEAISRFVQSGDHISMGGFTVVRNPMALAHEIVRQRIKQLHLYVHSQGQAVDLLVGAGCVAAVEVAYGGTGRFAPSGGVRFCKAVQEHRIRHEDYSNHQMVMRYLAGAMGVPFLPLKGVSDTDICRKWGFDEDFRRKNPRIPDKKLVVIENPFALGETQETMILVPAIRPDVTLLHVQQADAEGTCRIEGLTFADVEQAKASRHVIVTCERLVSRREMRRNPDRNQIPFFIVDAVVHLPFGAHPTACYGCYDYDDEHLHRYGKMAKTDQGFLEYLEENIFAVDTFEAYLDRIGEKKLKSIIADPELGYRPRKGAVKAG